MGKICQISVTGVPMVLGNAYIERNILFGKDSSEIVYHDLGDGNEILFVECAEGNYLVNTVDKFGTQKFAESLHRAVVVSRLLVFDKAYGGGYGI